MFRPALFNFVFAVTDICLAFLPPGSKRCTHIPVAPYCPFRNAAGSSARRNLHQTVNMPPRQGGNNRSRKKNKNTNSDQAKKDSYDQISIVGPDNIQVLQGSLLDKQVVLVLCGESHEDAIDVTRKGAIFESKEGWIEVPRKEELLKEFHNHQKDSKQDGDNGLVVRIFSQSKKLQPLGKALEWAKKVVEVDLDFVLGHFILVLLWIQEETQEVRTTKGKAYVLGLASPCDLPSGDDDDDEVDVGIHHWKQPDDLPTPIRDWVQKLEDGSGGCHSAYEWGDLDPEAFQLNKRRLFEEKEIPNKEHDEIIQNRKLARRQENIWTWDDWFNHVRKSSIPPAENATNAVHVELIIEATVPPWEVALYRPPVTIGEEKITLPPANDCIRQVPSDEEGAIEDEFDPSSDGAGSYLDFVYRRFMDEMIEEWKSDYQGENGEPVNLMQLPFVKSWVHCVDVRDLGCAAACHADSLKDLWDHILNDDELATAKSFLDEQRKSPKNPIPFRKLEPGISKECYNFLPQKLIHPEFCELQNLRNSGIIISGDDNTEGSEEDYHDEDGLTFPSFEGFFGQNTDFLYYTPHIKLNYSPFLAKCVKSFSNWEDFFTKLFLGGTIPEAMEVLDLEEGRDHIYVRSPIHKCWNQEKSCYEYYHRPDGEHYVSFPFFPFIFYLCAKGSTPPRTWSSALFSRLCDEGPVTKDIALRTQSWVLDIIRSHSSDPKGSDDPQCGGEWFEAYLRAAHRDIHDDIDLHDSAVLLQKSNMKSLTSNRKYNIGKIQIPSCHDGFQEIIDRFNKTDIDLKTDTVVTDRVEVLAKILIDIYVSNLVDFTTVLKVTEIVSKTTEKNKVMVVCYMGSAHTRAVTDFYTTKMGFKKKAYIGKHDWQENEPRSLKLPKNLWDINGLFR